MRPIYWNPKSGSEPGNVSRRTFIAGSALVGASAFFEATVGTSRLLAQGTGGGDGLPQYWNGWNCLTDDYLDPINSTFSTKAPPTVISRSATSLDVLVIGNDSKVWYKTWTLSEYNSTWTTWAELSGGPFSNLTPVAAVAVDASTLQIFVIGNDNNIWTNQCSSGIWSGYSAITSSGNVANSVPITAIMRGSSIEVMALGTNSCAWRTTYSSGSWSSFAQVAGGPFNPSTGIAACAPDEDHLDIFMVGNESNVWTNSWTAGAWFGWYAVTSSGNVSKSVTPACVSRGPASLDVVAQCTDGKIYQTTWAGSWSSFAVISGGPFSTTSGIALCNPDSTHMNVFVIGTDSRIWSNSWNSSDGWLGWYALSDNASIATLDNFLSLTPSVVSRDSLHLDVVNLQADERVYRDTFGQTAVAVYVPLTTSRICQLTSNYDPAGLPHINNTLTPWGVAGTDCGYPVEFGGTLYLLYGDVPTESDSPDTNPNGADPILYTTDTTVGTNGITLGCITQNSGVFNPYEIAGYGVLGVNETPIGAFTYNDLMYVFTVRGNASPYTSLTASSNPSVPFTDYYDISTDSSGQFLQIAPWVIENADVAGLPSSSGDGLLFWGWSFSGISLAWAPLTPGVNPPPQSSIQYYAGSGSWSTTQSDSVPVVNFTNLTSLNVTYLEGPQMWLMLYTRAQESVPHESIIARIGINPFTWSDEIYLFNPDREGAWSQYMHVPGSGDNLNNGTVPFPDSEQGYAYSANLLNRFTLWNPTTRIATLYFTIATWCPYQIQLMKSEIQFE